MSNNSSALRDDHVFLETRIVIALVIVVLILAFLLLYLFPDHTDEWFAWTIKPKMTALMMGAGYIGGGYFFLRVLIERKWHRVQLGFLPITGFTIFMLLATFLHWDRFNQGSFAFGLWTVIYILTPFLVPFLWWRNHVADPGTFDANDATISLRTRQMLTVISIAGSLLFFIVPAIRIAFFPWMLTPLTARVGAGWWFLAAATVLTIASDARWSAARILVESGTIALVLMLIGVARAWSDFNPANPMTWIIPGSFAALIVIFISAHLRLKAIPR